MTSRIDRTQRTASGRPAATFGGGRPTTDGAQPALLPAPVGPVLKVPRSDKRDAGSAFEAQLLGQDGQKRGLRAGPPLIDAARKAYSTTEWSGRRDRRAPQGHIVRAIT